MHNLLSLTPSGHLVMVRQNESKPAPLAETGAIRTAAIAEAFGVCQAEGLIALAGGKPDPTWPLPWAFWREFAARYLTALCQMPSSSRQIDPIAPPGRHGIVPRFPEHPTDARRGVLHRQVLQGIWNDLHAW